MQLNQKYLPGCFGFLNFGAIVARVLLYIIASKNEGFIEQRMQG